MPLLLAPLFKEVRIIKILANDKVKKHLESLGIVVNATISVVTKNGQSIICQVKESRLALDENIAKKIFIV